jgi:RNA polymerase sigma factor (sigma-70 family)
MTDDAQLLRHYAERNSQPAFAELVRRHVGWIYQASLRRTGERHDLAQDVVQQVFLALARHAGAVARHESVAGWLYITTRYAASHVLRAESRRRKYESAAGSMNDPEQPSAADHWAEIRPLLDEALDRLPGRDRDALLQRFFEGMSVSEMAAMLGIGEDGVRKRLDRALDKLRASFDRRGISSTAAALGALLGSHASAAVPPAVQALAANAPWSAAAAQPALTLGVIHLMNTTKAGLIGAGLMGIAAVSSLTFAIREVRAQQAADAALVEMTRRVAVAEVRPRNVNAMDSPAPANPISRAALPVPPTPRDQRRADGEAFLRQHPEVRGMLAAQFRAQVARNHTLFYRKARLTPAQIETFEARVVAQWLDTLEVTPSGLNAGKLDLPARELAAIFGADGFRQWQEFERERVSDYFVRNVALSIKNAAEPLTAVQLVQIMSSVSQSSPEFRAGGTVDPVTVDWAAALARVEKVLSPAQWREAQPWLQKTYVDAQLKTLAGIAP